MDYRAVKTKCLVGIWIWFNILISYETLEHVATCKLAANQAEGKKNDAAQKLIYMVDLTVLMVDYMSDYQPC